MVAEVQKARAGGFMPCSNYFSPQTVEAVHEPGVGHDFKIKKKHCFWIINLHETLWTENLSEYMMHKQDEAFDEVCLHERKPQKGAKVHTTTQWTWCQRKATQWRCQVQSSLLSQSDLGCRNAFLRYTAFFSLQYISLATIVTFWISPLTC